MPGTPLPDFPPIPIGMDQSISSGEIPGINLDINLPGISIDQRIDVVLYGPRIYQDTAAYCTTISVLGVETIECFTDPETGDTLGRPFSFPTDSIRTMKSEDYNSLIVTLFDEVIGALASVLDTTINLGLSSIPLPDDPPIIASIDTLVIGYHPTNSTYRTLFRNNGIPLIFKTCIQI